MTRGQKGCFVYCVDAETGAHFERLALGEVSLGPQEVADEHPVLPLRVLAASDVRPYENGVPVIGLPTGPRDLPARVGAHKWVELPESFRARPGHFVSRVPARMATARTPAGSWCLFRLAADHEQPEWSLREASDATGDPFGEARLVAVLSWRS